MTVAPASPEAPIGLLDSGVGGLAVLREVRALLPQEDLIYIADQAHLPYGERSLEEVRAFTDGLVRFLLAQGCKLIVIPCNTASAAALLEMRQRFPQMPFVGMEPALRPAARDTQSGVIGVIATAATFQGRLYASLVDRFAKGVEIVRRACPEFVMLAERGGPFTAADEALVAAALAEIQAAGADQLVLGCTHFTFLTPLFERVLGPGVQIVDPAPAVAQQVQRVLQQQGLRNPSGQPGSLRYCTTGNLERFREQIARLLGESQPSAYALRWEGGQLSGTFSS